MISPRLGVVADDITGCGDVASALAERDLVSKISVDVSDITNLPANDIWIINTHSRNDSPETAAAKVVKAAELLKSWGADCFFKKIDSTLRGNIGSELDAFSRSIQNSTVVLCAAYPNMGRITKNSIHYVNGIELAKSDYSKDVKTPVKYSNILDILSLQISDLSKILLKDASSNKDLESISLASKGFCFAGSSAFAGILAEKWFKKPKVIKKRQSLFPALIVNGSRNPVSNKQISFCLKQGYKLAREAKNSNIMNNNENMIITTQSDYSVDALENLMIVAEELYKESIWQKYILNGGDTAYSFLKMLSVSSLDALASAATGVALCSGKGMKFILKPGGFGQEDSIYELSKGK